MRIFPEELGNDPTRPLPYSCLHRAVLWTYGRGADSGPSRVRHYARAC